MSLASSTRKKIDMYNSEEGAAIRQTLIDMEGDVSLKTEPAYTANITAYPDMKMPFVENHLAYLSKHSEVEPAHYLSNLRLMLRIR